jgi:hypothetical protein
MFKLRTDVESLGFLSRIMITFPTRLTNENWFVEQAPGICYTEVAIKQVAKKIMRYI